jgi:predicted HD phosphohydrolase
MRVRITEDILERVTHWFERQRARAAALGRPGAVDALAHALQCAQLAEEAGAAAPLVVAALLHDVGHLVAIDDLGDRGELDDAHELRGAAVLLRDFPVAVVEPVRLHVAAKRYLTTVDPLYAACLSTASLHSLAQQGGPMSRAEVARFEALPHARDAVRLRHWDDVAQVPGRQTPALGHYLALADALRLAARP